MKSVSSNKKIIPISGQTTALVIGEFETLNDCVILIGSSYSFILLKVTDQPHFKIKYPFITISEFSITNLKNQKFILFRKSCQQPFHTVHIESNYDRINCNDLVNVKIPWVTQIQSAILSLNKDRIKKRLILIFKSMPIDGVEKFTSAAKNIFKYADIKYDFNFNFNVDC